MTFNRTIVAFTLSFVPAAFGAPPQKAVAPRPSVAPEALLGPAAAAFIAEQHLSKAQQQELQSLVRFTRAAVEDTIRSRSRLTSQDETRIREEARARARHFLTPRQLAAYSAVDEKIIFYRHSETADYLNRLFEEAHTPAQRR